MVSQPTMRCILGLRTCLLGLTAILLLFPACGQNEGGRCQIDSDCASGLKCRDTSGNGVCENPASVGTTAAAPDASVASGPEVGTDIESHDSEAISFDASIGGLDLGSTDAEGLD